MKSTTPVLISAMLITATLSCGGCAAGTAATAVELEPVRAIESATVPQVLESDLPSAEKTMFAAGLVPMLRYEPALRDASGTVVATLPTPGTTVDIGSTVTLVIAGAPPVGLSGYALAHRDTVVGVARDAKGGWVVAVHTDADVTQLLGRLNDLAPGQRVRLQRCTRTWAELAKIEIELARRDFAPQVHNLTLGLELDPLACAVRINTDELTSAQVADLVQRYGGAVVVVAGEASRAGRLLNR